MTLAEPELSARAAQLLYAYARAVDDGDFAALEELFTPEVTLQRDDGVRQGREALLAVYRSVHEGRPGGSQHVITNVQASQDDEGLVHVVAYFRAAIFDPGGVSLILGRYADVLREDSGGLRFVHKGNLLDAVVPLGPAAARPAAS